MKPGLAVAVATWLLSPAPAFAQDSRYAGEVIAIGSGAQAQIRHGNRYDLLNVGDRLVAHDCVRTIPAFREIRVRDAQGNEFPLRAQAQQECVTVPPPVKGSSVLARYVDDLWSYFKPRLPSLRQSGGPRAGAASLAAIGAPRGTATIAVGHRSLYVGWCWQASIRLRLLDPTGTVQARTPLVSTRLGISLPETTLTPGTWTLEVESLQSGQSFVRHYPLIVVPAASLPLPVGRQKATPLLQLEQAAALARSAPDSRYDFEALQLMTRGETDAVRDRRAGAFCPRL